MKNKFSSNNNNTQNFVKCMISASKERKKKVRLSGAGPAQMEGM